LFTIHDGSRPLVAGVEKCPHERNGGRNYSEFVGIGRPPGSGNASKSSGRAFVKLEID
jgi:hypothetical protein